MEPTERRIIRPTFEPNDNHDLNRDLACRCREAIATITVDATSLPVLGVVFAARDEGVSVSVRIRVPDRESKTVELIQIWRDLIVPWYVVEMSGPDVIIRTMRDLLCGILAHEAEESIRVGRRRVFDPHRRLTRAK